MSDLAQGARSNGLKAERGRPFAGRGPTRQGTQACNDRKYAHLGLANLAPCRQRTCKDQDQQKDQLKAAQGGDEIAAGSSDPRRATARFIGHVR
jgi:hypothetical protein